MVVARQLNLHALVAFAVAADADPEDRLFGRGELSERLDRVAARVALPGASGRAADAVIAIAEGRLARTSSSARASAA